MYFKLLFISLITLAFVGCHHEHKHENHNDYEELKLQYTIYTEHYELFAEADPLVAGQISNILSHFSVLPEFTPVTGGRVTLKLIVNDKVIEQTLDSPIKKGIYSFDLKPEISGNGILEYLYKSESGEYKIIVPEVKVYSDINEATDDIEKINISKINTTVFAKEQSWKTDFSTGYPERKPFGQVIKTTAQIQSSLSDEVLVTAKTGGTVIFSGNNLLEGMDVSGGQALLTIKGSGFAENNSAVRFAEAKNNFDKAKADFERANELAKEKIVSEKQLIEIRTQYENAKSVFENLEQNFSAAGQTVISPMRGFVKQLYVKNGQYVEAGQPLALISQNQSCLLHAGLQQKYSRYLNSITTATIRTIENNKIYTLEELNGVILSVGQALTPDNFLIPVTLQINNRASFVSGSFVELYLKTITNTEALIIPNHAILEEQGNFFVYVQVNPELFEKREIKTGVTDGINTEVLRGLSDDERIVTKGAIMIKLSQATGSLDAHSGHVH